MLRLSFLLLSFNLITTAWGACPLRDGDVVFIKSQTEQAKLLKLATGSEWSHVGMAFKKNQKEWQIIEAVQPVQWTSLYSFVRRSKNFHFEVKRATFDFDAKKVMSYAEEHLGKNYDLIFGWDNERWYCTELVWKAYEKASKEELGRLEQVGDLNVDDPRLMSEAARRFKQYGMTFNAEEWKKTPVITPIQMMKAENLQKVLDHKNIDELKDCLL